MDEQVQSSGSNDSTYNLSETNLRELKLWFQSLKTDNPTCYLSQDDQWFLHNDFDGCNL